MEKLDESINEKLNPALIEAYMLGFNDELEGTVGTSMVTTLLLRAYELGRINAVIGDEVSSIDNQTHEEILNSIRNVSEKQFSFTRTELITLVETAIQLGVDMIDDVKDNKSEKKRLAEWVVHNTLKRL